WCFKLPDKVEPITFFVTCHPTNYTHYAVQDPDVQIVTVEFTQRPPDDLILILGSLLEANSNAQRRRDERIVVTPETMKRLSLESREASLVIDNMTHRCVLRDVSFSGAKVVAHGTAAMFQGKRAVLKITRGDQAFDIPVPGAIRRVEEIGGRKDILALGIEFTGDPPMTYKLLINSYIASMRKPGQEPGEEAPAAPAAAKPKTKAQPAADAPMLVPEDVPDVEGNDSTNG
ncbi:MAG TPA: PilZ domain-containing protein, partial [Spirochaetia bacterium]